MKALNLLLFFCLFVSCSDAQIKKASQISDEICKQNISFYDNENAKNSENRANFVRKKLIKKGKLNFFSLESPLYILEGYDLETGETYVSIWNKNVSISYVDDGKKTYQFSNKLSISNKSKKLLDSWNLKKIEYQEKIKGIHHGSLDISVQKIIFNNKGAVTDIKRFSFEEYDGFFQKIELVEPE